MHGEMMDQIRHQHDFDGIDHANEKRTLSVVILTGITMVVEIVTGALTGSMALLADGWHMGTHAAALGIAYLAYVMARKFAGSSKFGFGTGKFGILASYTSALLLGGTALYMIVESISRFIHPVTIAFNEAIVVAVAGLVVNVLSIWILHGGGGHTHNHHGHHHEHGHDHQHDHNHTKDHNIRAAYLHVIADALTSVFAIVALFAGKFLGWNFLDPVMGILGGILIARWAWGLLRSSSLILLDGINADGIKEDIVKTIEADGDSIVGDLHVWPLNSNDLAVALSVVSKECRSPGDYGSRLARFQNLKHTTIEVHIRHDHHCPAA
ncbi:MAG: CDF family Co(II)/Ni(II) efflux transporter DmeF [bacterium]|nr:CDF family Co(II)/Ni(II) efflux transporter DmeF [bacterium]